MKLMKHKNLTSQVRRFTKVAIFISAFTSIPLLHAIDKLPDDEDILISVPKQTATPTKTKNEVANGEKETEKTKETNSVPKTSLKNKKELSGLLKELGENDNPVETIKKRLEKVLFPYQLVSAETEPIDNPTLSSNTILSWRLIYTRNFDKKGTNEMLQKGEEEEETLDNGETVLVEKKIPQSFATVILIPAGAMDLEKALLQRKEVIPTEKVLQNLIFMKYGITWSKTPCQYERITLYLGSDEYFHYFASGDISVLYTLIRAQDMKQGADLVQLLIDNLMIEDENLFTKRFSIAKLGEFKDPVIPDIVRAIRRLVTSQQYPISHFVALSLMHTEKSFSIINEAGTSNNPYLRKAAIAAVAQLEEGLAELLPVYLGMVEKRDNITLGTLTFLRLGLPQNIQPVIDKILATPHSVMEFEEATRAKWLIKNKSIQTIHKKVLDDIIISSIRSGEIKDSPQYIDMNESKESRELRLSQEDEKRIANSKQAIIKAKEVDLSVITCLELALFYTADKRVSSDYVARINRIGIDILKELPRQEVASILNTLIKNNTSQEETAKLTAIKAKAGIN